MGAQRQKSGVGSSPAGGFCSRICCRIRQKSRLERYISLWYNQKERVTLVTTAEWMDKKHQEDLQRLRGFRLLDDDFMTKCFEGDTACIQLVLRIILEIPDLEVTDVRTQVFVENLLNRSVRLDVLATDSAGRKINVEIQREDKGAGRRRARYNSSMMDANILPKGDDFDSLPETYVVFITERDVLGRGKAVYHIDRYISDTGEPFEDGAHILYVNGAYRDETPIGKLMHDFSCTDPAKMHYGVLADRVRFFKESKEGVQTMCKVLEEMRKVERDEGFKEGVTATVLRMLETGKYALDEIAQISGLSLDEVKKLQTG